MNSSYKQLAYEITVFMEAVRLLQGKYISGGGNKVEELVCELVPYSERIVPTDSVTEVINRMLEEVRRLQEEMAQFDFRKRDERPPIAEAPPEKPKVVVPVAAAPKAGIGNKTRRS
jgi:hypothetical protein